MAIFGPLSTVRLQLGGQAQFTPAFAYVADLLDPESAAHDRIRQMEADSTGRIELADGAFVIEQVYQTRPRPEVFFESHRKYIDVQVIVEGAERMEVEDISRLTVSQPYLEERDLIKYADTAAASHLAMPAGNMAIFFPVDGHMSTLQPAIGPVLVRKAVVKVPVEWK
jgi:biofilm protein TabA